MDTSLEQRITAWLETWDGLGIHRTGTAVDEKTAGWLIDQARAFGAKAELVPFAMRRRTSRVATLQVGNLSFDGLPAFDSPSTGPAGVGGNLVQAMQHGTLQSRDDVVLMSSLASGSTEVQQRRREGNCAAIITVNQTLRADQGIAPFNADDYATPFGPPLLQLAHADGQKLIELADRRHPARLVIHDDWTEVQALNVEAQVPGREHRRPPWIVMTPRSSWWHSTSERGGGIVVWLELLRHLVLHPPRHPVWFTANTGHELGHLGLHHLLHQHADLSTRAHGWLHLGANFAAAEGGQLRLQASHQLWLTLLRDALLAENLNIHAETPLATRPFGEAREIFDGGGRFISLLGNNDLFHHPADRWPTAVNVPRLAAITRAFISLFSKL